MRSPPFVIEPETHWSLRQPGHYESLPSSKGKRWPLPAPLTYITRTPVQKFHPQPHRSALLQGRRVCGRPARSLPRRIRPARLIRPAVGAAPEPPATAASHPPGGATHAAGSTPRGAKANLCPLRLVGNLRRSSKICQEEERRFCPQFYPFLRSRRFGLPQVLPACARPGGSHVAAALEPPATARRRPR